MGSMRLLSNRLKRQKAGHAPRWFESLTGFDVSYTCILRLTIAGASVTGVL